MTWIKIPALILLMAFSASIAFAGQESVILSLEQGNLEMFPPFTITNASIYRDGGTIAIIIKDARGTELPICLDGRIKVPEDSRYLYAQTTYPNDPSKKISPGSNTEKSILNILKSAKIVAVPNEEAKNLVNTVINKIRSR